MKQAMLIAISHMIVYDHTEKASYSFLG